MTVREIMNKVNEIITIASPYMARVDIYCAAINLTMARDDMWTLFSSEVVYTEKELELKKDACHRMYIRLEYMLSFLDQQRTIYESRYLVHKYFNRASKLMLNTGLSVDSRLEVIDLFKQLKIKKLESMTCGFTDTPAMYREIQEKLTKLESVVVAC